MITLSKDMEIGVKKVDDQHRELIDRINDVSAMGARSVSNEETQKTIDMLGDYIVKHFGDEEGLQMRCGYPKYEWHKGQHKMLINEYQRIKNEFAQFGPSPKFTLDLSKSIIDWVVRHIKSADVEFGRYYNAQKK
ncbi:MAG: hemerythrin family protein [Chitinispirillales bacterium]|jgi:hemerythrin|nr:hemerythrin family protein [Chitinispirillales bacterium]